MLREFCRVVSNDEDFVGLHFAKGLPEVVFPRGYSLNESDKDVRQDIIRLLSAIQRFGNRLEGERISSIAGEVNLDFPIGSYHDIIVDFLRNGYYSERETRYIQSSRGKMNWKRTVQKEQPYIDGGNVVYLDFVVKANCVRSDSLLKQIHEYCVYESFQKMGWLFSESEALPMKPRLPFRKQLFLSTLLKEFGRTFNDNKKRLLKSMINIIKAASEQTGDEYSASFGVHRFEYIWEAMIDYVFGENTRLQYDPKAHWHIISQNGLKIVSSELRPDTIMRLNGKIYILDAKYYKYGITGIPAHLPNTDSIQKQITYGDYIAEKGFAKRNDIYNAFLMPYCKSSGETLPYKFVSVGVADWRSYGPHAPNYYYVLGILVDTKYLISTYAEHNVSEIERLSRFLEDSLKSYRTGTS